jgi:hypothetical protein
LAGCSGTPLAKKLGIKPGSKVCTIAAPDGYRDWLGLVPQSVCFVARPAKGSCDVVHIFVDSLKSLERELPKAREAMTAGGAIWVSWYKKSSKIPTDVSEDVVRARALQTDLVDVKVCAVSDVWSGLKLVVRKHLR